MQSLGPIAKRRSCWLGGCSDDPAERFRLELGHGYIVGSSGPEGLGSGARSTIRSAVTVTATVWTANRSPVLYRLPLMLLPEKIGIMGISASRCYRATLCARIPLESLGFSKCDSARTVAPYGYR
jgi:hypothetical protein